MKYANVFYIPHFNVIGGIETYAYELAKKYKGKDIVFVYSDRTSDINTNVIHIIVVIIIPFI